MKKSIAFLLATIIILSCNVHRKDKIADDQAAQMEKASKDTTTVELIDSVYNFGTVTDGEKVEYNFRFKNTGTKPLVVDKTQPGCGCTVAKKPEKPVLPGEIGFIKIIFNSEYKIGHNEKTIEVTANTKPDFPTLTITGEVIKKKE
ncbi:MAG: DUF1573 domain-containing protein [Bacteroidota bacterium]